MRLNPLQPRAWLVPVALAFGVASCADSIGVGTYIVTYRANTTNVLKRTDGQDSIIGGLPITATIATIDSITYSNGTTKCTANCNGDSTLVKVSSPSVTFSVPVTIPRGSIVEGHLYGSGTVAGTAKFTVVWTTATGEIAGDSVTATTAPATKFTLTIAKRIL